MHKSYVKINNVATCIRSWGRWIEETPTNEGQEEILLLITGNPGLTGYYDRFLGRLHEHLRMPCWALGHAGHEEPPNFKAGLQVPPLKGNHHLYDVKGQVDHKVEFFKKYVPEGTKVHVIGHSIGAYIILQLLKIPEVSDKIANCYLLFPTIERMADSPNGRFLVNVMSYLYLVPVLLSYIFMWLPGFLQHFLIYFFYCLVTGMDKHFIPVTCHLIRPGILRKVFFMAFDEMEVVRELDTDLLRDNRHRIKLYYSVRDGWAPLSYATRMQEEHPDINSEICSRNFDHAYILRHSNQAADMLAEWITAKG